MIRNFIGYVNEASAAYGSNVSSNAQYIKQKMDDKYGDDEDNNFYIFIQTRLGQDTRVSLYHPQSQQIIAGRTGINRLNPSWSYIFLRDTGPTSLDQYASIAYPTRGPNFDSNIEGMVSDIINNYQTGDICYCYLNQFIDITSLIDYKIGIKMSVICDDTATVYGLVYNQDGVYGSIQPRKCIYTLLERIIGMIFIKLILLIWMVLLYNVPRIFVHLFIKSFNNYYNIIMSTTIIKGIDDSFAESSIIIMLDNKGMVDAQFQYLLKKETHKIVTLYLGVNKLIPLSMSRMSGRKWDSLTYLYLGQNIIGDKGCKCLSRVEIPQMLQLDLTSNKISSLGVSYLAKAQWKQLQWIQLQYNKIGVDGGKQISKSSWLTTIREIFLTSNQLTMDQVSKLILCVMPKIKFINLYNNRIEGFNRNKLRCTLQLKLISAGYQLIV